MHSEQGNRQPGGRGAGYRRWWLLLLFLLALPLAWIATASHDSASAAPSCPLDPTNHVVQVEMTLKGCPVFANAVSSVVDPLSFWGAVDCESPMQAQRPTDGGDPSETALGEPQWGGNEAYRRLTVFSGNEIWGGRCELGLNDREGPTTFYHEGQHRVTYISERLPSNFPLATEQWQTVMAMSPTDPSHPVASRVPVLYMEAFDNAWHIDSPNGEYWEFPATKNRWTRFAFDVYYSQDPSKGWIQVSADLNGNGSFNDPGERSPVIHAATLATEAAGSFNASDGLAAGAAIPSYLRAGIDHSPSIPCPAPSGCSVDLDNIQVIGASEESDAPPPPPQRHLTISFAGTGGGTVRGPGISCPGDCTQTYADGTDLMLTATPDAGSSFAGWSGSCSGSSATCDLEMNGDDGVTATFETAPPPCPLSASVPGAPVGMTLPGCKPIASDTASESSPLPFWGSIQCQSTSRYSYMESGGDLQPTATGEAQGNGAARRLTVLDGDNFFGERCELGENYRGGPTAFYHEGQHRVTYFSERLPSNFPLATNQWQTVMQMKQAQSSHDSGGGVALEMEARDNEWVISNDWHTIYSFPARAGVWTRFAFDVYYSQDPSKGWIQVSADLNGDGDFNDPGERSPVIHAATLATEAAGSFNASDGLAAGAPIPSHLRMGIYHDPSIPCPAPSGCSVEVDNVQVVGP